MKSDPNISNAQGKQKMVRYSRGSIYTNVFKANQIEGSEKPFNIAGVRYIPCSILPSSTV